MVRSFAAVLFIGAVAAVGIYVGTRPTIIHGDVMAADLLTQQRKKDVVKVECDPRIPLTATGATFECLLVDSEGSSARVRYKMSRAGKLEAEILSTAPHIR